MSKAVLIKDMPECCAKCDAYIEEDDMFGIFGFCFFENKEIPTDDKESRMFWCPLKPLPRKQPLTFLEHGQDAIAMGWNACLEEIEKEST